MMANESEWLPVASSARAGFETQNAPSDNYHQMERPMCRVEHDPFHVFICTTLKETFARSPRYRHHLLV
jgi:hypothetical protein